MLNFFISHIRKNLRNTPLFHALWFMKQWVHACANRNVLVYSCRGHTASESVRGALALVTLPPGLLSWLLPTGTSRSSGEGTAIVAIAKNEGAYIEEWLKFHYEAGGLALYSL